MFYPFTATAAMREAQSFYEEYEDQREVLLEAYLKIAHVYIERACMKYRTRARVYCPFEIYPRFESALLSAGYHFKECQLPNNYIVSWGEDD